MRLAVFGGAFDPIHVGHVAAIRELGARGLCDRILVVPAGRSPGKPPASASAVHRLAMVRLALDAVPAVEIREDELRRPGPSYTVDTLEALARERPDAALLLVAGADAWAGFKGWRRPERILELARPVVLARGGETPDPAALPHGALVVSDFDVPAASSEVRVRLSDGRPADDLVPPPVLAYIRAHGLYAAGGSQP